MVEAGLKPRTGSPVLLANVLACVSRAQLGENAPHLVSKEEADRMWVRPQNPVRGHSLGLGEEPELTAQGHSRTQGGQLEGKPQQDGQGGHRTLGCLSAKDDGKKGWALGGPEHLPFHTPGVRSPGGRC